MNIEWKTCFRIGISTLLLFLCIHYSELVIGIVTMVVWLVIETLPAAIKVVRRLP